VIALEKNMGVSKSRNDGIKASNGELILVLASTQLQGFSPLVKSAVGI